MALAFEKVSVLGRKTFGHGSMIPHNVKNTARRDSSSGSMGLWILSNSEAAGGVGLDRLRFRAHGFAQVSSLVVCVSMSSSSGSYQVLARRYRPQVFSNVVGQRAVVQQLHNEIREGRVGHGYLFCGPRGTGKTSLARIFAKALNCEQGPTTEPCGKCHHCQEIAAGTHLDVSEVDAATYTKADDTKGLLEGLRRAPFSARYKIYIIDEVHMLSTHSFNALLKSLEEPPERVVFVLATTNPEKIPETVISRCRRCNFERLSLEDITGNLADILEKEGVAIAAEEREAVLAAVALASEGGLRDAQVFLDQLITLTSDELNLETVRSLLGVVESDLFLRLLKAIVEHNTADCLLLVGDLVDRGRDLQRFVRMFLSFLRDAMLLMAGGSVDLLRFANPHSEDLKATLEKSTLPFMLNVVQQFLDLEERIKGSAPPRFLLEFALIKLTAIDPKLVIDPELGGSKGQGNGDGSVTVKSTGSRGGGGPKADLEAGRRRIAAAPIARESAVNVADVQAAKVIEAIPTTDGDRWAVFLDSVGLRSGTFRSVLSKGRLVTVNDSRLDVELAAADRSMKPHLERPESVVILREAARQAWQRPLMIRLTVDEADAHDRPVEAGTMDEDRYVSAVDVPEKSTIAAPVKQQPKVEEEQEALSFAQAMEKYPEFAEACRLVEEHFKIQPAAFNGIRLAEG